MKTLKEFVNEVADFHNLTDDARLDLAKFCEEWQAAVLADMVERCNKTIADAIRSLRPPKIFVGGSSITVGKIYPRLVFRHDSRDEDMVVTNAICIQSTPGEAAFRCDQGTVRLPKHTIIYVEEGIQP